MINLNVATFLKHKGTLATLLISLPFLLVSCNESSDSSNTPNILFIVMDDVGIDQMAIFTDGTAQPTLPNINAVATAGVRFRNTWSMPECSPGRAAMFTGRYPLRTGTGQAIGENDLANSHVTEYEMTIPKLLKKEANYTSGLFGKFHLGGPENTQFEYSAPSSLGWDYFFGNVGEVGPRSIDTTAGGIADPGTYQCGYVHGQANGGADLGACYFVDNTCQTISSDSELVEDSAGLQCITQGGVFQPNQSCQDSTPPSIQQGFLNSNAYYADEFVINDSTGTTILAPENIRSRGYRTTLEADAAIDWINSQNSTQPWMATVSFSAAHTPVQQAPSALTPNTLISGDGLDCSALLDQRVLQNQMTEAMDTEFGRVLVETGLATRNNDGTLNYNPNNSNTMIVIVGDNGTLGTAVKLPFNPARAKGTPYQTGVWVPLIVSGPLVTEPGRDVEHMTNMVDVFQLFAEFANVNANDKVPRTIDSAPLLAYLSDPYQSSIRSYNFTQGFPNIQANDGMNPPCVIGGGCTHLPPNKSVCNDNGGVWWGSGWDDKNTTPTTTVIGPGTSGSVSYGFSSSEGYPGLNGCAEIQKSIDLSNTGADEVIIATAVIRALRNNDYKYVIKTTTEFYNDETKTVEVSLPEVEIEEFYAVNQSKSSPLLDNSDLNLMEGGIDSRSDTIQDAYNDLKLKMSVMMASQPTCTGDGNKDGVVDQEDLSIMQMISDLFGGSSSYDLDTNGSTEYASDSKLIQQYEICQESSTFY